VDLGESTTLIEHSSLKTTRAWNLFQKNKMRNFFAWNFLTCALVFYHCVKHPAIIYWTNPAKWLYFLLASTCSKTAIIIMVTFLAFIKLLHVIDVWFCFNLLNNIIWSNSMLNLGVQTPGMLSVLGTPHTTCPLWCMYVCMIQSDNRQITRNTTLCLSRVKESDV